MLLGFGGPLPVPSARALRLNRDALGHHRAGHYDRSLAETERAIAETPGYAMARFNRACALSRLRRFAESAAELRALLAEDPPTFFPRLESVEDLDGLRRSEQGRTLQQYAGAVKARYSEVVREGAIALSFVPRTPYQGNEPERRRTPYVHLRLGVYHPASRRFVAITAEGDELLAAAIDRSSDRVLVVRGRVVGGELGWMSPRISAVELYSLSEPGRLLERWALDAIHGSAFAKLYDDRVMLRDRFERTDYALLLGRAPQRLERAVEGRIEPPRPYLALYEEPFAWEYVDRVPADITVRGRALLVGNQRLELSRGHGRPRVVRSPDGQMVVIVSALSATELCAAGGEEATAYLVDLADLGTGDVTRLEYRRGRAGLDDILQLGAAAAFAADGTLLLQTGGTVRLYAPGSTTAEEPPVPIRLFTPWAAYDCEA